MDNILVITAFIDRIWNHGAFDELDGFLHPEYKDYSLISSLSPDRNGLESWIKATGLSFEHLTLIEDYVSEDDKIMLRIKMKLKHVGNWRDIPATGTELETIGYRHFRLKDGLILEHWALLDGQHIENELKNSQHGCGI